MDDMSAMQQDDTDVMAREFAPKLVNIAQKVSDSLTKDQQGKLDKMARILQGWDGRFNVESTAATAYSFTMGHFIDSLLLDYYGSEGSVETRLKIVDSYFFMDFL